MTFAVPWALAGLALAAIPILLHLLARRDPPTVLFPATRYLADATRLHQRRLQLQHLLLLLARTLLVAALVLAAAGPSWPRPGLGAHPPTAAVVIFDNSLSSGAIRGGVPTLDGLRDAARAVLERATAEDRLWLLTADLAPRPGTAAAHRARLDSIAPALRRLDLSAAVGIAADLLAAQDRPGEIVVISDVQRSALGSRAHPGPVTVLRPGGEAPPNAGLGILGLGSQPWGPDGGTATIAVLGAGEAAARPVVVTAADRPPRQLLVPVGGQGSQKLTGIPSGWWEVRATLDPDELRADDARSVALRVAPAARVAWSPADRYLATAADVLAQNGRIVPGSDVSLGALAAGASVVLPPADPAQIGALNRSLGARGSSWRFGDLALAPTTTDSGPWLGRERLARRHRLVFQGGAPTDVLVTAGGEPWAVRSGRIVLLGSRLEPEWSSLPISAAFLPFLDGLLNRAVRGEVVQLVAAPGDRVLVPDRVTGVASGGMTAGVEGGASFAPVALGIHYLLADRDTIGAVSVNPDPRESDLTRATEAEVEALWPRARMADLDRAGAVAFQGGGRSDLRGPLLWIAAGLALVEVLLATAGRARRP